MFEQMCSLCFHAENELQLDIMRLGSMSGSCRVCFATVDGSAKAGVLYSSTSGEIILEDGQTDASIMIPIIANPAWAPTMEFKVHLSDPRECELGQYLHTCRVKIFDRDHFPSERFAQDVDKGSENLIRQVSGFGLLREYCKLNFRTPFAGAVPGPNTSRS